MQSNKSRQLLTNFNIIKTACSIEHVHTVIMGQKASLPCYASSLHSYKKMPTGSKKGHHHLLKMKMALVFL